MNAVILLAAGRGARFGAKTPKQFIDVLGRPVLAYALEAFQRSNDIDIIAVVCQPEHADRVRDIARAGGVDKLRRIVPGGESCPESIRKGIDALREDLSDGDIALLHMGVSPLVTGEDIAAAVALCREKGCAFTMHPVNVCLARRGGADWSDTDAPKEDFVELNTPWAFRYGDVWALYHDLDRRGKALGPGDYTLGLWLASGRRAWFFRGSDRGRLKITTPHDRDLFEGLLRLDQFRKGGHAL